MVSALKKSTLSQILSLGICWLVSALAQADESVDVKYFSRLLFDAKIAGRLLPDIYRINPEISERLLYSIQKEYVGALIEHGDVIAGFKGGFVPKASVGGVLFGGKKILSGTPKLRLKDFRLLVVEAEIGFKFCKAIVARITDINSLKNQVCGVMPVVEIADGAIADFAKVKQDFKHLRNTLISINVASSHTLVGELFPVDVNLSDLPVKMLHDGNQIGNRDLGVPFEFWRNLLWIVNEYVLEQGYAIRPGNFIIAGNLTGIHAAQPGEYVADFSTLGSLRFRVE